MPHRTVHVPIPEVAAFSMRQSLPGCRDVVLAFAAIRGADIVYDITPQPGQMPGISAGGWGHATGSVAATAIAAAPPPSQ